MAQNNVSSPTIIYDTLVADATFMSYVGTYTFTDGSTAPSLSIVTPGRSVPNVASQTGLEVVIHDIADLRSQSYISSAPDALYTWKVFLVVWEPETGEQVINATTRLLDFFPLATSVETVSTGVLLGSSMQTQVLIPSESPILTP